MSRIDQQTYAPIVVNRAPKRRLYWADVAKGISILGVVLLHIALHVPDGMDTFLADINHFLDPVRMPLFFMVSGFFAVKVLKYSFRELATRRLWFLAVPYLLWTPLELWSYRVFLAIDGGHEMPGWSYYAASVIQGTNMYWFLHALVLFTAILWVTRYLPAWATIALAFAPILLLPMFVDTLAVVRAVIYLPVFLAGAYLRDAIAEFAESAHKPPHIVAGVAAYVAGMGILAAWTMIRTTGREQLEAVLEVINGIITPFPGGEIGTRDIREVLAMMVALLSMPAGLVLAANLARCNPVRRFLSFLGRHTLVIYLGHALGLTLIYKTLSGLFMDIDNTSTNPMQWTTTWILIGFLCAAAGAYAVHLITKIPIIGWSLMPPTLDRRSPKVVQGNPTNGSVNRETTMQSASSRQG